MSIHRRLYQCMLKPLEHRLETGTQNPGTLPPPVSPAFQDPTLLTSDAFDHLELLKLYLFSVHMESEEDLQELARPLHCVVPQVFRFGGSCLSTFEYVCPPSTL